MMQIVVNFDDTYVPVTLNQELTLMTFMAPQKLGADQELLIKIEPLGNPFLPNVFNLGFGPPDGAGGFVDNVRLKHENPDKVFSTVLFMGLAFLGENEGLTLGVDGSDDLRATLYQMMFKTNKDYLDEYFIPLGVDYYVRIFRDGSYEAYPDHSPFAKPKAEAFDYDRSRHDLYRYYLFRLK